MATQTQDSKWTLKRLLEWTAEYFGRIPISQPRLSAEILLAHALGCQRIELYTNFAKCPNAEQLAEFRQWVKRCGNHEPVAYLTGKGHFFSLEFKVTTAVLIPRPETELLVTEALEFIRHETYRPTVDVLDMCTGSGCIAVAIAQNAVETEIVAVDNSNDALAIANENVKKYDLQNRITLIESDMFNNVAQSGKGVFDIIVSNPPYIAAAEYELLDACVRDHEPRQALFAGDEGLDYIRRIIAGAEPFLADSGILMLEIAYNQAKQVTELCNESGYLKDITAVMDHQGHNRVIKARKK